MPIKASIATAIRKLVCNKKHPRYSRFLYTLSSWYVDHFKGEMNADVLTNGELRLLQSIIKNLRPSVVFDVGANNGDYAHNLLDVQSDLSVHCFEPDPVTFEILRSSFQGQPNVICNDYALSDASGTKKMYLNKEEPTVNSFYDTEEKDFTILLTPVKIITLDDYCSKNHIDHIDFMKVDTEGHEFSVLRGSESMLKKQAIDCIQFEFGNAAIYARVFFRDIYDLLQKNGYEIYKIKPLTLEKVKYIPEYEKIMYANFFAVRSGINIEKLLK